MTDAHRPANFPRNSRLAKKLKSFDYRHSYLASHTRNFLARQFRELRGDLSQEEFGKKLGMRQNVVSRLENPGYGRWTLQTLLDVARALDIGLVVRFTDFPTFLSVSGDQTDSAARPLPFDADALDRAAEEQSTTTIKGGGGSSPPDSSTLESGQQKIFDPA